MSNISAHIKVFYFIQIAHLIYGLLIILVIPLMSKSPYLLYYHLFTIILTLATRAEYNSCILSEIEGKETINNNVVVNYLNFNLLFFLAGTTSILRLIHLSV